MLWSGRLRIILSAFCFLVASNAKASDYPARLIQVVVPFAGGSGSDVLARIVLDRVGAGLGQRIVIDNRPAAGGNVGTLTVAKATPDGYTLLLGAPGPLAVNTVLLKDLGYDPVTDFEPVSQIAYVTNVFAVSANLPVRTVAEFLAYAKARPSPVQYSSVGIGSSQHLGGAVFSYVTGIPMTHVPYRSAPQLVGDLISGIVPVSFSVPSNVLGPIMGGQIRALAVTGPKRLVALPDVPTIEEAGVKNFQSGAWFGLVAPKGTPREVVDRLNGEIRTALKDQNVIARMAELGAEPTPSSPEEFRKFIVDEIVKWRDVIARADIKAEAR